MFAINTIPRPYNSLSVTLNSVRHIPTAKNIAELVPGALQCTLVSLCWEIRLPRLSHLNRCTALFAGFHCMDAVCGVDRSLIYNTPQGDIQPLKSSERSLAGRILIDPSRWNNSRSRVDHNNADLTMCTGQRFMIRYFWRVFETAGKLPFCLSFLRILSLSHREIENLTSKLYKDFGLKCTKLNFRFNWILYLYVQLKNWLIFMILWIIWVIIFWKNSWYKYINKLYTGGKSNVGSSKKFSFGFIKN